MSGLPKQIQAQLEEAERIQQQLQKPPTEVSVDPVVAETEPPQPAEPPEPAVAAPAEPPAEPQKDAAYWEHRFRTLDGIYKADKARMDETMRSQGEQLQQLMQQIRTMQTPAPQPQPQPQPETPLVSDKDEDKFGSDLIDMARRVSREELRSLTRRLDSIEAAIKTVAPQVQRVAKVEAEVAQTREDRFWSELTKEVPDWESINEDQKWLAWLKEYDPIAGKPRQASLLEAQQTLDHRRVVAMFKLFKGPQAPAPQPKAKQNELARQVAPARNSTVTTPSQTAKTYTGKDYAYWLDPRRLNDTALDQVVAMKAELERAYVEGRIQW